MASVVYRHAINPTVTATKSSVLCRDQEDISLLRVLDVALWIYGERYGTTLPGR